MSTLRAPGRDGRGRRAYILATSGLLAAGLCACTPSAAQSHSATGTTTPASSPLASVTTDQPTVEPSGGDSSAAGASSVEPAAQSPSPTGPSVLNQASGRVLTLSDFFEPSDDWEENRFNIADKSQVQGIAAEISSCNRDAARLLELRLSNEYKTLTFSVGQANTSDASDQSLTVEVTGNNSQIDIRHVPFNKFQQFKEPVAGVNALQIRMYLDSAVTNCGQKSVIGVLSDAVVS